jgi:hypothetical protein
LGAIAQLMMGLLLGVMRAMFLSGEFLIKAITFWDVMKGDRVLGWGEVRSFLGRLKERSLFWG